jgi:hypothetical protein
MGYASEHETKSQWWRRLDGLPAKPSKERTKTKTTKGRPKGSKAKTTKANIGKKRSLSTTANRGKIVKLMLTMSFAILSGLIWKLWIVNQAISVLPGK